MMDEKLVRIRQEAKKWIPVVAASAIFGGVVVASVVCYRNGNALPMNYVLDADCLKELTTNPDGFIVFPNSKNIISTKVR